MIDETLTEREVTAVARDLCRAAGKGNPMHRTLHQEIRRAMCIALNSPTFAGLLRAQLFNHDDR